MPLRAIKNFLSLESSTGILLLIAATLALIAANSPLSVWYDKLLSIPMVVQAGNFIIDKPLLLWINDGLMALFFLLIGLEVKREVVEGELSSWNKASLPVFAAIGGMVGPCLVYLAFNHQDPVAREGWAIPAATDIAFALGILALLGKRVPATLKILLLALAIIDDLGAIIIIAVFYTSDLSIGSLVVSSCALLVLLTLNLRGVTSLTPYVLVGLVLWASVLKSGVHATLAGVALGVLIPLRDQQGGSPSHAVEHTLHPWVAFLTLPLFAFANAGVKLDGFSVESLMHPIPLGIALGLFLGKQVGVFGFSWLAIKLRLATLPTGVNWGQLYGLSMLTGIGFTMSLFIGSLAFENSREVVGMLDRVGILTGSLFSGVCGYFLLRYLGRTQESAAVKGALSAKVD